MSVLCRFSVVVLALVLTGCLGSSSPTEPSVVAPAGGTVTSLVTVRAACAPGHFIVSNPGGEVRGVRYTLFHDGKVQGRTYETFLPAGRDTWIGTVYYAGTFALILELPGQPAITGSIRCDDPTPNPY